jgi:hypothetical protein
MKLGTFKFTALHRDSLTILRSFILDLHVCRHHLADGWRFGNPGIINFEFVIGEHRMTVQ